MIVFDLTYNYTEYIHPGFIQVFRLAGLELILEKQGVNYV